MCIYVWIVKGSRVAEGVYINEDKPTLPAIRVKVGPTAGIYLTHCHI